MKGRAFALVFCILVPFRSAFAEVPYSNPGFLNEARFCATVFRVRAELAQKKSASGEFDRISLDAMVAAFDANLDKLPMSTLCGGGLHGDLVFRQCSFDLEGETYSKRPEVENYYAKITHADGPPPICMEDPLCVVCRDMLRTLTD